MKGTNMGRLPSSGGRWAGSASQGHRDVSTPGRVAGWGWTVKTQNLVLHDASAMLVVDSHRRSDFVANRLSGKLIVVFVFAISRLVIVTSDQRDSTLPEVNVRYASEA